MLLGLTAYMMFAADRDGRAGQPAHCQNSAFVPGSIRKHFSPDPGWKIDESFAPFSFSCLPFSSSCLPFEGP